LRDALGEQLRQVMVDMEAAGLNHGSAGNASLRLDGGLLITPSGVPAQALRADAMVAVRGDGAIAAGMRPSSEWRMHQAIYAARADVDAIVHCHSRYATALACRRQALPAFHYMVALFGGHSVPCAPYATFGSEALAAGAVDALGGLSACLLANHGQITVASDPAAALALARELEELAAQYLLANARDEAVLLDGDEMDRVLQRFGDYRRRD
jgi:L-fuculose-phosphate aldolase